MVGKYFWLIFIIKDFRTIVFIFFCFHNVSADMSSGLLQMFVELGNLHFELRPLLNPQGSPILIRLAITGYKC